jgi:phosphopantothenoylcysteine decarboxylase/phosphopantothenate--cysteine ligase
MYDAATSIFPTTDGAVMAAAVADYTPAEKIDGKLKRDKASLTLSLVPTRDIAAQLGSLKKSGQLLVGFALEATNEQANAQEKMRKKNLDLIVLNSMNDAGAGFDVSTNKVTIFDKNGRQISYNLKPKIAVACDIVDEMMGMMIS